MNYHSFNKKELTNYTEEEVEELYDKGYLATRIGKGIFNQTVSLRIRLEDFEFNSENRRIIRKTDWFNLETNQLTLEIDTFDFSIMKLAKDFYFEKNGKKVFSSNKVKELLLSENSNFNKLLAFNDQNQTTFGYTISLETKNIFHYAYPFYDLKRDDNNIGMGMILKSIQYSIDNTKKYFYLGSVTNPKSFYKLQFNNMEWWDGEAWKTDIDELKEIVGQL